jgi:murein DD-endopeptidase
MRFFRASYKEPHYHLTEGKNMNIPTSSLYNQAIQKKKKFRFGLVFLFIVSVGLNVFFLFFGQETNVSVTSLLKNAEDLSQLSVTEPPKVLLQEIPQPAKMAAIKPVLLKVSPERNNDSNVIHSLNFTIRSSMNFSVCKMITRENGCAALSAHLARLMAWLIDIKKSMRNGDSMEVLYQRVDGPEQFKVLKLSYKSQLFARTFAFYYFDEFDHGNGGYFDIKGNEIAHRIVEAQSPIRHYIEITSLPGDFRKGTGGHSGTDFKAEEGTSIYSGFSGKVLRINWNIRANGYCVEIDHPKLGIKTLYLHLSRVKVKPGQIIQAGQQIAESGNTGRTFAPHLHYEIQDRKNKKIIYSPFNSKYHKSYTRSIPPHHHQAFKKTIMLYNSVIKES